MTAQTEPNPNPMPRTIRISAQDSEFTYQPSVLRAQAQDTVTWICDDGPFAVEFTADSPGLRMDAHGVRNPEGRWQTEPLEIRGDARGHYHYAVAVFFALESSRNAGQVALDAACPEIIVK